MSKPVHRSILTHFAALKDPRQCAKVLYPLTEILLLALAATIAGADDFVEVTLWGEQHQSFLRRFFPYALGIPSHDTMCDVFAAIDPDLFKVCFQDWVKDLRDGSPELIAIDGKPHGAAMTARKDASPCTWFPPGQPDNGSCWGNRRARKSPTRSPPFRCC